jgi:hypothetical protein
MMDPGEIGETRGMDSNDQYKIQEPRVYQAEERFSRARELLRFKAVTKDIVQNALKIINGVSAEEMQKERLRHPEKGDSIYYTIIWII